jgi:hypothetical protein
LFIKFVLVIEEFVGISNETSDTDLISSVYSAMRSPIAQGAQELSFTLFKARRGAPSLAQIARKKNSSKDTRAPVVFFSCKKKA